MEKMRVNGTFCEMTIDEMQYTNGGGIYDAAIAVVTAAGAAFVGGFMAGRQFVRDIKNKFFAVSE